MLRRPETRQVAEFLYDLLVARAPSNDYAKRVAERMNVPYPSLARYWQGKAVYPAGLIHALFLATDQDMRVAEFFLLDGCDYRLERMGTQKVELDNDFSRALMSISELEGEVNGIYLRATQVESEAGAKISFGEARMLEEALRKLTRIVEDLRSFIRQQHLNQD